MEIANKTLKNSEELIENIDKKNREHIESCMSET